MNYRLYAFVANHYLSPLQCGLQTAHVVSEIFSKINLFPLHLQETVHEWALRDKTIIICGAGNHKGVVDCYTELQRTAVEPGFAPAAIFYEDAQSMNFMATACGVIVPECYWAAELDARHQDLPPPDVWRYQKTDKAGNHTSMAFSTLSPEGQLISHIKKYRLA